MPMGTIQVVCHVGGIPCQRGTVSEVYTMSVGYCITGVPRQGGFMSVVSHVREIPCQRGFMSVVSHVRETPRRGVCQCSTRSKGPMMSAPYHQWDATWQGALPSVHNHHVSLGIRFVLLVITVPVTTAAPTD